MRAITVIILIAIALTASAAGLWLHQQQWLSELIAPDATPLEATLKNTTPEQQADAKPSPADEKPSKTSSKKPGAKASRGLDIARINPDGPSVIAGYAPPNEKVAVTADGAVIGTAKSDQNGDWVLVTKHKFKSKDPQIAVAPGSKASTRIAENNNAPEPSANPQAPRPNSADAVNTQLMQNLETMVAKARDDTSNQAVQTTTPPAQLQQSASEKTTTPNAEQPDTASTDYNRVASLAQLPPEIATQPEPAAQRDAKSKPVPIPVGFVYREASFTDEGRKAIRLLGEYLNLKQFERVVLTGHADERGSRKLNMALSQERLATVAEYLKGRGYTGELVLIPKGETVPFEAVDRTHLLKEELYKLDRRVELIETR